MIRSFRYPLRPTRKQEVILFQWLDITRELYNAALQERRDAWKKQRISVQYLDQQKALTRIRSELPDVAAVPAWVLRGALRRIDRAFKDFFRRVKAGKKPGHPRFRSVHRWHTLSIDDLQGKNPFKRRKRRLQVPKIGLVKIHVTRPLKGRPKALRIKRDSQGRWWATLTCVDVPEKTLPRTDADVGIDLGLKMFAVTSDGEMFENPRPMRQAARKLKKTHRIVSKRKRGSNRRRKAVRILARRYERMKNVRRENHINVARAIVSEYDTIYHEALNIQGLARSRLAKSVNDAGWGNFLHWLRTKAEEAGRAVVEIDPRYTSQTCPGCGVIKKKELSEREHRCGDCDLVLDRDVAAAMVILGRGRRLRRGVLGYQTPVTREVQVSAKDRITSSDALAM